MYNVLTTRTFWPRELNNDTFHRCRLINPPSQYISISISISIGLYFTGTCTTKTYTEDIPWWPSNNFASGTMK